MNKTLAALLVSMLVWSIFAPVVYAETTESSDNRSRTTETREDSTPITTDTTDTEPTETDPQESPEPTPDVTESTEGAGTTTPETNQEEVTTEQSEQQTEETTEPTTPTEEESGEQTQQSGDTSEQSTQSSDEGGETTAQSNSSSDDSSTATSTPEAEVTVAEETPVPAVPDPSTESFSSTLSAVLGAGESDTDNTDFNDIHSGGEFPGDNPNAPVIDASATTTEALAEEPEITTKEDLDSTGQKAGGTIFTGSAFAHAEAENILNRTRSNIDGVGVTNASTILAQTDNTADLTNNSDAQAITGENNADGGEELATLVTGDAVASAEAVNVVNTNIFNSDGLVLFLNPMQGDGLDIRDFDLTYFLDEGPGASPTEYGCTVLSCLNSSALKVLNKNVATVDNDVYVRAATGDNMATSTEGGSAYIRTGDAYAAANVLNLVNTNFINSSYLVLGFNNFGDLNDDIVLPDADFFDQVLAGGASLPELNSSSYVVSNDNDENFTGTATAKAMTGENIATTAGLGSGDITTGTADSFATSYTAANQTRVGGASVLFSFNVYGDWSGQIKGLPSGLSWRTTANGFEIYSTGAASPLQSEDLGQFNSSTFLATSTNVATIDTNVEVLAETGRNTTDTVDGNGEIRTGDAYASANVVNLVNTNIVGRNWMFGTFNIFGDWSGDIAFGGFNPDLAVTATTQTPGPLSPDAEVKYNFTVQNKGDVSAHDVLLEATYDKDLLTFTRTNLRGRTTPTGVRWELGSLAPGESIDVEATAYLTADNLPAGSNIEVPVIAKVSNVGRDQSDADNATEVTVTVATPDDTTDNTGGSDDPGGGGSGGGDSDTGGSDGDPGGADGAGSDDGSDRRGDAGSDSGGSDGDSNNESSGGSPAPASGGGGGGGGGGGAAPAFNTATESWVADPLVTVTKRASVASIVAPEIVEYEVVVSNAKDAGPVYSAQLVDTMISPTGETVYSRAWNLQTIEPGDQITITYEVEFPESATPGLYDNTVTVSGFQNHTKAAHGGKEITPAIAVWGIEILPNGKNFAENETPTLTGDEVDVKKEEIVACVPLITTPMGLNRRNDAGEVTKLQEFLAKDPEVYPRGLVTGYFGLLTHNAVKAFQNKYAEDVLHPLNLYYGTGYVGESTIAKINELACPGGVPQTTPEEDGEEQTEENTYTPPPTTYTSPAKKNTASAAAVIEDEEEEGGSGVLDAVESFFKSLW